MKRITASWPADPRTNESKRIALIYAVILVIMSVAQLFSFDKFLVLLEGFELPGAATGQLVAALLVVSAVFALPFLLGMKLSRAMRWLSMIAGWAVPIIWLALSIWVNLSDLAVGNIGMLGASVTLLPGWWAVFVAIGLGILAAWSSWGLWPGRRKPLEHRRQK